MKTKLIRINVWVIAAILLVMVFPSVPVAAANPVQIVLGGSGATPWNIGPIAPGDSGTKVITVQNTGYNKGDLTIWLSNIVNTEGTNPEFESPPGTTGELGQYLTLNITSGRLTTNISMPALLTGLPQSASDTNKIQVLSLLPGETVTLNWNWSLPPETGNIVQGDSLSFTINYLLEDFSTTTTSPGGGGGIITSTPETPWVSQTTTTPPPPVIIITTIPYTPPPPGTITFPVDFVLPDGTITTLEFDENNRLVNSYEINSDDGLFTITFEAGTQITTGSGRLPARIVVTKLLEGDIPANAIHVYEVSAYDESDTLINVSFNPPVPLTLRYSPDELPDDTIGVYLAHFDEASNTWIRLEPPPGSTPQPGELMVLISHLSLYGIFADIHQSPVAEFFEDKIFIWLPVVLLIIALALWIILFVIRRRRKKKERGSNIT